MHYLILYSIPGTNVVSYAFAYGNASEDEAILEFRQERDWPDADILQVTPYEWKY